MPERPSGSGAASAHEAIDWADMGHLRTLRIHGLGPAMLACLAAPGATQDPTSLPELLARAQSLRKAGQHADALPVIAELQQRLLAEGQPAQAITLCSWSATAHRALGQFERELEVLARGRQWVDEADFDAVEADAHVLTLSVLESTALRQLGRWRGAVAAAERAVAAAASQPALRQAMAHNSLGLVLVAVGRPAEALAPYRRAQALLAPTDPRQRQVQRNFALGLLHLGHAEAALTMFDELATALPDDAPTATVQELDASRAAALILLRRFDEALALLDGLAQHLGTEAHALSDLTMVRVERSRCLRALGRLEAAQAEADAVAQLASGLPDDHPCHGTVLRARASALRAVGEQRGDEQLLVRARDAYEAALAVDLRLGNRDAYWDRIKLALLLADHFPDQDERALALLQQAITELEARRMDNAGLDEAEQASLFRRLRAAEFGHLDPYENRARILLRHGRTDEALADIERSRARSALQLLQRGRFDLLATSRARAEQRGETALALAIDRTSDDLEVARSQLRRIDRLRGTVPAAELDRQRLRHQVHIDELSQQLLAHMDAAQGAAEPLGTDRIRAMLQPGERMLVYLVRDERSQVFVAPPPGGTVHVVDLVDAAGRPIGEQELVRLVSNFRGAIGNRASVSPTRGRSPDEHSAVSLAEAGHALFRVLVPPAVWSELEHAPVVYVVPHGALHLVPFEALVVRPGETAADHVYWLDAGPPVAYGPSGSVLAWSAGRRAEQRAAPRAPHVVVVAAPDFTPPPHATALPPERGATIERVPRGGAGARAGLQAGDVLVATTDAAIVDARAFRDHLQQLAPGTGVRVQVWRCGHELGVTLASGALDVTFANEPPREAVPRLFAVAPELRADAEAAGSLTPLPGAAHEAAAIAAAWQATGRCDVRLGAEATEAALFALAADASLLHIASHQVPAVGTAWSAGRLVLCPPAVPNRDDDGSLEVDDLLTGWTDRLRRCELVVLSSCQSRLGMQSSDEGVFGFPWGFQYAGCPCVLASQWPVDDESTAELMAAFHQGLAEGTEAAPLAVLTEARRALRQRRPEPIHWAPFVWIGCPR